MEKSFTESLMDINELSEGNDLARAILLDIFYTNIPDDINNSSKNLLNRVSLSLKRKNEWKCGHENCEVESCYSHEISENLFLKFLADQESKVVIMERDISDNVLFYREKEVHKRNASNFPGYCSSHDSELFRDIENSAPLLSEHFVNKQSLRSIHRKKFDLLLHVRQADIFIDELKKEQLLSPELQAMLAKFESNKRILLKKISLLSSIYDKVFRGINENNYFVKFREVESPKLGYCFAEVVEATLEKDLAECVLFIYKMDFDKSAKTLLCWIDNETSAKTADEIEKEYKSFFVNLIVHSKEKIVFSAEFLSQMNEGMKNILLRDNELYNFTPIENYHLTKEFFELDT